MKKQILKIFLLLSVFFLLPSFAQAGTTSITAAGVNGAGGFPALLATSGETYRLAEDITCSTDCLHVKATNITVDLNGHTMTFGNANNPDLLDTDFENWTDPSNLTDWTITSGTVTRQAAVLYGNYDALLSATGVLKSSTVTLKANQTYMYFASIKGSSSDTVTLNLRSSDGNLLQTSPISGADLNRAIAVGGGTINATENEYRPTVDTAVYLEIVGVGSSTKVLHMADIKPVKHYGIFNQTYWHSTLTPDLFPTDTALHNSWVGNGTGLIVKNGTITQGAGRAVKSAAVYSASDIASNPAIGIDALNVNMSGNNTTALELYGNFIMDGVTTNTSDVFSLNRMHPTATVNFNAGMIDASGVTEIRNCQFYNSPGMALRHYGGESTNLANYTHQTWIHDNVFRNREVVVEGYGLALNDAVNFKIYNNDFDPYQGRGILLDAAGGGDGKYNGTSNVEIYNNTFQNLHEFTMPEFSDTSLESAGIRIRNWGETVVKEGHQNLRIHDNTFSGYVDATTTHRTYGINIGISAPLDSVDIYNNTLTFLQNGQKTSDWGAYCFALQNAMVPDPGYIKIHNNKCMGENGIIFGGSDGASTANNQIYSNEFSTTKGSLVWYGANSPTMTNNQIYCNKINNTSTTGFPFYFEDLASGTRTVNTQYISNNLVTSSNSGGYEFRLANNYSSGVTSCSNGSLDIFGGGQIGTAVDPCHDGFTGCYSTAGLTDPDTTPPAAPTSLAVI